MLRCPSCRSEGKDPTLDEALQACRAGVYRHSRNLVLVLGCLVLLLIL